MTTIEQFVAMLDLDERIESQLIFSVYRPFSTKQEDSRYGGYCSYLLRNNTSKSNMLEAVGVDPEQAWSHFILAVKAHPFFDNEIYRGIEIE